MDPLALAQAPSVQPSPPAAPSEVDSSDEEVVAKPEMRRPEAAPAPPAVPPLLPVRKEIKVRYNQVYMSYQHAIYCISRILLGLLLIISLVIESNVIMAS